MKNIITVIVSVCVLSFAQTERWVYTYNGSGDDMDEAYSITCGQDGNIYAAGYINDSLTANDFTLISLTGTGSERWVYTYNGSGDTNDVALSIIYGTDDNIYAAGYCTDSINDFDFVVISMTNTGTERWVYVYDGPGHDKDIIESIEYGSDGNIYLAGRSVGNIEFDFTVISLTSTGTERWVYRYDGTGHTDDCAYSLVYGLDNNIYVAGYSYDSVTIRDFAVISLTTEGTERWLYTYDGPANSHDRAYDITYGTDGNIYACGYSVGVGTSSDFTVISLTSTGTERWISRYEGPINDWDIAYDILYGADGNIYTAGFTCDSTYDAWTVVSLTTTGTERWFYRHVCPGFSYSNSLVYGGDSNLYSAGEGWMGSNVDFIAVSVTNDGDENWTYAYNGAGNYHDCAYSLDYGNDGYLYIGGYSVGIGADRDFTVISLDPATGIEEGKVTSVKNRNFGATVFKGPLLLPKGKKCRIYDITGRVVMRDKIKPGVYFIEVDGHITGKVVKVR